MKRNLVLGLVLALFTIALSGCKDSGLVKTEGPDGQPSYHVVKGVNPNYMVYLQANADARANKQQSAEKIASAAGCPPNDGSCATAAKAFAAIALMGSGNGGDNAVQAPPRERDWAEKLGSVVGGLVPLVNGAVAWHQSDVSKDTNRDNVHYLDHVFSTAFTALGNAQPNINVGGNYGNTQTSTTNTTNTTTTTTDIATTYGNDYTGGNRTQTTIGNDYTGGTRTDHNGTVHTGDDDRYSSPGPFDDHSVTNPDPTAPVTPSADPSVRHDVNGNVCIALGFGPPQEGC